MTESVEKGEVTQITDNECSASTDTSIHELTVRTDEQTPESEGNENQDGDNETKKSFSARDSADACKDEGSSDADDKECSAKEAAVCPNGDCGVAIARNKKGQYPKICYWCNEDLSSLFPDDSSAQKSSEQDSKNDSDKITDKQYDIEIQPLTRDSECGYCCLKLIEIEEPRVLPCGHIQCTQCIAVDSQNPEIVCKICKCEMCTDLPVQATNFCADCKRKLCTNHSEDHVLHTTDHELIAIEDELTPERYEVQRCEKHTIHVLNEICKHCMKLFCKRCDTGAETCTGGDVPVGITDDRAASADMKAAGSKENVKEANDARQPIEEPEADVEEVEEVVEEVDQVVEVDVAALETKEEEVLEVNYITEETNSTRNEICSGCDTPRLRDTQGVLCLFCGRCGKDFAANNPPASPLTEQDPDSKYDKSHAIIPLLEQTTHMREELRQKSQAIYNKMKRCRDMEKSTWKELSEVEDAVTAAQQEVDTIANDMIRKIKDEADEIKAKFTYFYNDMSAEVDKFSDDKLIGITKLDVMYMEGQQLADRRPDSQLLKEFIDVSARLSLIEKDISFDRGLFIKMPYLVRGTSTAVINAQLMSAPMSIEYVSTAKKANKYYGVKWIDGGELLCSTSAGFEIRKSDMTIVQEINTGYIFSADLVGHKLYTHASHDGKCITYIGTQEEPHRRKVHEETYEANSKITHISVSKEILAIVDYTDKMLKVMTVSGEHMFDIKLKDMKNPFGVHLLPAENSVLVTDYISGELRKYKLEPDAEPVWTCAGLEKPSGVTTDESGLIYVTSNEAGKIYVITPQGKKLHELTHSKLTEAIANKGWNHDVSVSDGKMVVACRDQGVMLFNIR